MPLSRRYSPEWAPGEQATIGLDFSSIIPPGVGIASGTLTIDFNVVPPASSGSDFTIGAIQIFGRVLYVLLAGGVVGRDYLLNWVATDTDGNIWPRTALLLCAPTS